MKKVLFVIGSFAAGGAERSLINQLTEFDHKSFEIYAYIFNNEGLFREQLPPFVKLLPVDSVIGALMHSPFDVGYFVTKPLLWIKKVFRTTYAKLFRGNKDLNQIIWDEWRDDIHPLTADFDVAVGQQEGLPNYFVMDKTTARNKILWIHNEYEKLGYDADFDRKYFSKAKTVVTISKICRDNLCKHFPELDNFRILPNISSLSVITSLADERIEENFFTPDTCNIISIGRLERQKNFELAVAAAFVLKSRGFEFRWIVIGEGTDRAKLQSLIDDRGMADRFFLIGTRVNPYKYLNRADVAVQTSLFEGKSIFADEAQMLCKVFVSTPYDTVGDVIIDGETGLIAGEMSAESVADEIQKAILPTVRDRIVRNLKSERRDNTNAIRMYYEAYGLD